MKEGILEYLEDMSLYEEVEVKGQFYKYPHTYPNHYVKQQYLPDEIKNRKYYEYGDNKTEQAYKKYWEEIKK
jgi:putative ATPase